MFDELNIPINCDDIMKAIDGLHHFKSIGPDRVLNEFIISGKNILCQYLCTLFSTSFISGHFPQSWVDGCIIPLHKKGSINNVNNYRGITLLSCLGKLFTTILNSRLSNWAENYHIYILKGSLVSVQVWALLILFLCYIH